MPALKESTEMPTAHQAAGVPQSIADRILSGFRRLLTPRKNTFEATKSPDYGNPGRSQGAGEGVASNMDKDSPMDNPYHTPTQNIRRG